MHGHRSYAPCALPHCQHQQSFLAFPSAPPFLLYPFSSVSLSFWLLSLPFPFSFTSLFPFSISASTLLCFTLSLLLASLFSPISCLSFSLSSTVSLPPHLFIFVTFAVVGNSKSSEAAAVALPQQMATAALDQATAHPPLLTLPPLSLLSPHPPTLTRAKQSNPASC